MQDKILLFIPMYNCAPQIPRVLAQIKDSAVSRRVAGVLCVDNGSRDATLAEAERALADVPVARRTLIRNNENYGLGGSHKVAFRYALDHGYSHVIVMHGDDQAVVTDLLPLIEAGRHGQTDCLLGARFMRGSRLEGYSWLRIVANIAFNILFSLVARRRLHDLGSGLNMYRSGIFADNFHLKFADDLTFNYYLLLGACAKGLSLRFFPLTWRETDQVSNARLLRQGIRMLALLACRALDKERFMTAEFRGMARSDYPYTVVKMWGEASA